jgi:hypothetical protein
MGRRRVLVAGLKGGGDGAWVSKADMQPPYQGEGSRWFGVARLLKAW